MTLFAINSQAYREISLKAENMCRAQKIAEQKKKKNDEKALNENSSQPRTPCFKKQYIKVFKSIHTRIFSWVSSPREK